MSAFHDLKMNSITGEAVDFSTFAGKRCLIVNVASR
jgi:glutathione peroxidase-family protein